MATKTEGVNKGKRSISTVIALILGIIALILSPVPIINNFAFVIAIVGLIFGIVGYQKTKNGQKKGRKTSIISIILTVLAGVIVLASQAFYSDAIDDAVDTADKEAKESFDSSTGKNTDDLLANDVSVEIGKFQVKEDEFMTETTLPVKITNKNSEAKSYEIKIEAVDSTGKRIADDTVYVDNLGASQSQEFKAFQFVESDKVSTLRKAKFKILTVSQY
jgi:hypothetical protein